MASFLAMSQNLADSITEGHPLECPICLERMKDISFLSTQPDAFGNVCNHYFCTTCIQPMISRADDPRCPVCRRSVLAVNRSKVANELLREVEQERDLRKKAIYEKEEIQHDAQVAFDSKKKLEEKYEHLQKSRADKQEAKVREKIEKFRKACELQLEEERKDKEQQIKNLQQKLNQANATIEQWKGRLEKERRNSTGDKMLTDELQKINAQLKNEVETKNHDLDIRSKELDQALLDLQTTKTELTNKSREVEAKNKELETRTKELESKTKEIQLKSNEVRQKSLEIEKLKLNFDKITTDAELKAQETIEKDQSIKYLEQHVHNKQRDMDIMKNELEEVKKLLELRTRQLEEQQKNTQRLTMEVDKWQSLCQRANEELNTKNRRQDVPVDSPDISPKSSTSSFGSWLSPNQLKISNPLSYLWTTKTGPLVMNASKFQFLERRGSSRNSSVWKATCKSSDKTQPRVIALKKIDQPENLESFREPMLLYKFDHKNILKLEGVLRGANVTGTEITGDFMIIPFLPFDLEYVLSGQVTLKIKASQVRIILYQILSAIMYMHSGEVVHRDLKPTSILLDELCQVKLGSFGQAKSLLSQPFSTSTSNRYSAPENCYLQTLTRPAGIWKASDMWAIGCIFYEMLKGSSLFDSKEKNVLLSQICSFTETKPTTADLMRSPVLNTVQPCKKEISLVESLQNSSVEVTSEAYDLLKSMLTFDPAKRITASEALKHRYFTDANLTDVHRTCPSLQTELKDTELLTFVDQCGGL